MTNLTERARELRERLSAIMRSDASCDYGYPLRELADLVCELAEAVRGLEGTEVWK